MSSEKIVCQGAMCKCSFGDSPDTLKVISKHKEYVNEEDGSEKMILTTMDIGQPFEAKTFGQCKLQPTLAGFLPCVPSITQWQGFYDKITVSNNGNILTEKSKAICAISGAPCVEITWHGQTANPTEKQAKEASQEIHSQLNPLASPQKAKRQKPTHDLESLQTKTNPKALAILYIDGPFDNTGKKVSYISPTKEYTYQAMVVNASEKNKKNLIWSVTYDDDNVGKREEVARGGTIKNDKIEIKLSHTKGIKKLNVYAQVGEKTVPTLKVPVVYKQVVAFFIGGAGDKESYYGQGPSEIMKDVRDDFYNSLKNNNISNTYTGVYLGYNEVRGEKDLQKNVIDKIPNKKGTQVCIIGHSLGGWNGAHLSQILTDKGYTVDILITLDPVGIGGDVKIISDIYFTTPTPKSNYWIHTSTEPENYQMDDLIADLGGQWKPKEGMQIKDTCTCNHRSANTMFTKGLKDTNISASDMLLQTITNFLVK